MHELGAAVHADFARRATRLLAVLAHPESLS